MGDIITALKDTPVPTILIVAGIGFLLLAIAGQIAGKIEVPAARQKWAAITGTIFVISGVTLHLVPPDAPSTSPGAPASPTPPSPSVSLSSTVASPGSSRLWQISVNSYVRREDVYVTAGDAVSVVASGNITVADYIDTGPDGINVGTEFNIVRDFPHGALICRIFGESNWYLCGANSTFVAQSSGYFELNVNDIEQSNNNGAFDVTVQLTR